MESSSAVRCGPGTPAVQSGHLTTASLPERSVSLPHRPLYTTQHHLPLPILTFLPIYTSEGGNYYPDRHSNLTLPDLACLSRRPRLVVWSIESRTAVTHSPSILKPRQTKEHLSSWTPRQPTLDVSTQTTSQTLCRRPESSTRSGKESRPDVHRCSVPDSHPTTLRVPALPPPFVSA